ncbi:MAG: hypothetical protein COW00_14675 [Bdellovibrio sp. CG12_big_fil_rev_8_21_14_0_65_39_13]|nr:MAG: hypothetical protein COW78_14965 [Bdellovibrio sp. CG22_combo_CG10-13_8_21_14_all_39_27]PIQ58643.1 MAG: hypothetical protein COW00_14675 [Bdellovibrio sp. CG12_big_fil_rev_8_21_14_0_65_39_13]PIR33379.1 MAG: hypothetical protein COV37_16495 [Bdellovibrio sp. CG11_big_fil_rev_8_21_14_0_20_39_38]
MVEKSYHSCHNLETTCYSAPADSKESATLFNNRIWLSTDEAARYLGKTRNAIWILLSRGLLMKRKWRRRLYFKRTELDRLLETSLT